jgi:tetratricopeptide (TPR) repeat protein
VALALAVSPALAQVAAPSMVEDELPQEEAPAPKGPAPRRPAPAPVRPGEPLPEPAPQGVEPQALPSPPAGRPAAPPAAAAVPGVTITPEELAKLQRPIEPVRATYEQIPSLWAARRQARRDHDSAAARAARGRLLEVMRELGIENLATLASAQVREAERAIAARSPDDALEEATFAVELAPDLAESHLALARSRFDKDASSLLPVLSEVGAAVGAALREPHTLRAFLGDLSGAALAALFVAAAATILLLFARRLRHFLHDFAHLPIVRAGAPLQAAFLAVVILSLPVVFRLGTFVALFALAAASWLYLSRAERGVVTAALLSMLALPHLALAAASAAAWTGTLAEQVFELEHGADTGPVAAALEARTSTEGMPAAALMALGKHYKRRGDLDTAVRWYESAAAADPRSGEVQVNLGNAQFLKGNLDGAKAAYQGAIDRAGSVTTLAAAHYNLSKVYLRQAAVEQQTEARKKALLQDRDFVEKYGSDDDFRANRYLIDVSVPEEQVVALARADGGPRSVAKAVHVRLAGSLPPGLWPAGPLCLVGLLWLLVLLLPRIAPSRVCERCGRPACTRCDAVTGGLCGQCVNVFERRGIVDARDRLLKEAQVRRYQQWRQVGTRVLAMVGGGLGHLFSGMPVRGFLFLFGLLFLGFVAWFWRGIVPPPQPSPYTALGKLTVSLPLAVAVYLVAVRDAFRRSGEE